jgi:hypothetical protein
VGSKGINDLRRLQWFERVGYSADIAGLEREFGRTLTKLPDWARGHARQNGR